MAPYGTLASDVRPEGFQETEEREAVVVVDPISSGAILALMVQQWGYVCVAVYSAGFSEELLSLIPKKCKENGFKFDHVIQHHGDVEDTASRIRKLRVPVRQVMVGCESGVELNDHLCKALGLAGNGVALSPARRNKYLMGERIRACGLRAVRQLLTSEWTEIAGFINSLNQQRLRLVVKPVDSAGTDSVFFCDSMAEVKTAFETILKGSTVFGQRNTAVLVQEYLQGTEYVVDSVSKDGEHKVVAMWQYDKRRTNDAQFVYYGLRLFESTSTDAERTLETRLTNYAFGVLDALEIRNGPSHAEIMWLEDEDEPCLVEVGARPHGGEGTFVDITEAPIGYNQLSVGLDALRDPTSFSSLPLMPPPLKAHAAEVCLVSLQEGEIVGHGAGLEEIKQLKSFQSIEFHTPIGGQLHKTVDIFTSPGSVLLGHTDLAVLNADYERIHEIENKNLFIVKPTTIPSPTATATTSEDEDEDILGEYSFVKEDA